MQTSKTSGFRLSYQQRRLWRHAPESVLHAQCVLSIVGEFELASLERALREIVARHDILRTTFPLPAGLRIPVQAVAASGKTSFREVDLQLCPPENRAARVEACRAQDQREPFDLAAGPMLRASLLLLSSVEHALILTLPAHCADAASMWNLVRELRAAYLEPATEAGDIVQYVQFSEWQQSQLEGEDAEQGRAYWRSLHTLPPLVLPLLHAPRDASAFVPASCEVPIDSRLCGVERPDAFLLACWTALLGRVSGQSAVRIGLTCAGRNYPELEAVVGPVARVVPIGCTLREGMRFGELNAALAETVDQAGDWQEFYERRDNQGPYEPVGFECNECSPEEPVAEPVFRLIFQQACPERFDLKLSVTRAGNDLRANLNYDPRVLPPGYPERLAEQLGVVIRRALDNADTPLDLLPMLGEDERRFLLESCNDTRADYPRDTCVHHLFAIQAARTPDSVAVVFEGAILTYGELDRRANRLAHRLRQLGVGPEVLVGICVPRSPEMIVGLLAVLKSGGSYVPLEPAYPAERLAFMLADAQVSVLLTERRLRTLLPATAAHVLCLDDPFEAIVGGQPESEPRTGVCAENLVYALYTSGSTGKPKGALIAHRSLVNYLIWCCKAYAVDSGAGTVVHSSIGFDATITALLPPLLVGNRVELLREAEGIEGLPEAMRRSEGFGLIKITPAHLSLLSEAVTDGPTAAKTQALVVGGDALSGARLASWRRLAPQTRLINEYGPTETVVGCCVHEVSESDLADESVPIGRPIANTKLFVLDAQLAPLPAGVPGELFIAGDGVCRGYLGRPALTAERFLPDYLSGVPGTRFYRTGDLTVQLPGGVLSFLGRLDRQVKIRSYRIELGEIEAQLERYPGVAQSVVVARTESSGEKSLVAYVESARGIRPTADQLRSFLRDNLPEHMVPATFAILDALPLTAHGKVDRAALPGPETLRVANLEPYAAPQTPAESTLVSIWCDVLKVERIGIHDDFFRSGGDSILSILVVARAAKAGLRFTTRDLFQHPTVAELASMAGTGAGVLAIQGTLDGAVPLTPIQQWFFERQLPDPGHFNQAVLLAFSPGIQTDLVRRSLAELISHHDALRLRFTHESDGWRQVHGAPEATAIVSEVDVSGLPSADRRAAMRARAEEAQAGLNISRGPLMRAVLFRRGGHLTDELLLAVHHLVVDGVSWRILLEDFATAYRQLARGEAAQLPDKTTPFQLWATRLRDYAGGKALNEEAQYWLRTPVATTALPVDFSSAPEANTVASGDRVRITLDRERTSELLGEASEAYRTKVEDVLLTALVQASARWTGSSSLTVDLEGHGREEIFDDLDVSRTVGWFTSLFPVHLRLEGRGEGEELKAIKEQLRGVPQRGIGYGILRYLSPDTDLRARLAAMPKGQVSFNYLGRIDGLAAEPVIGIASHALGAEEGPLGRRPYLLDVIGQVAEGCLQLEIVYSASVHRRATVENLGREILSRLESLVAHCLSSGARGFTPSDFPEAGLSQEELDQLVAELD